MNRQPVGLPSGGQFAAEERPEANGVSLSPASPEAVDMLWCESCNKGFDEGDAAPLYECGTCGTASAERRCDQCNRFMARSEAPGCPICEEPVDETPVPTVVDHDGEVVRLEDYDPDGPSKAERDDAARARSAAEAEAARAQRLADKRANQVAVRAADIEPGAVLIDPNDDSNFATEAEVLRVRHVDTPDGPIVVLQVNDYGKRVIVRRASDPVATSTVDPAVRAERRAGRRLTAEDFGTARLIEGFNDRLGLVSSPSEAIDVITSTATRNGGTLPVVALMAGRRNLKGSMSGTVSYVGVWTDPDEAASALDEIERAANVFAVARTQHPPSETVQGRWSRDMNEGNDFEQTVVAHTERDWVDEHQLESTTLEIGYSDWEREKGALLVMRSGSGMSVSFDNPQVLKDAVAEARKHLGRLTGIPARPDVVDDKI